MDNSKPTTLINAASADARIDETSVASDQKSDTSTAPAKKPRYNKPTSQRRGGAAYLKEKPSTSLSLVPRLSYFPIFTSNLGCLFLAQYCYNTIRAKDFRLGQSITLPQLQYVCSISWLNRLIQCAITFGYNFPPESSRLKQIASGIQLPSVLATYVESIGRFTLSSGVTVVPFCGNYDTLFPDNVDLMMDPVGFVRNADPPRNDVLEGHWQLDVDWIVSYNNATTRATRSGMNFRSVNNLDLTGRAEMLVSYQQIGHDMLLPKAPQCMSEAEAQLGVCYRNRDYTQLQQWFGINKELLFDGFTAIPCDPQVVFSDVCVAAFKGAQISLE